MSEATRPECRVLYVDDSKEDQQILREAIDFAGVPVTVRAAGTARAATDCLASGERYDVLLVDWSLPGLTGIDFLKDLRKAAPTQPLMILTGEPGLVDVPAATRLGARTILRKPLALEEWEQVAYQVYDHCGEVLAKATATGDAE